MGHEETLTRATAPYRPVDFLPVDLDLDRRADGTLILKSRIALDQYEQVLSRLLARQAATLGNRPYLLQRMGPKGDWNALGYQDFKQQSDSVGQFLLDLNLPPQATAVILSGNSLAHAVFKFGALAAGVPVCPVSVNYGTTSGDFGRLAHVLDLIKPAVIFVEDAAPFKRALETLDVSNAVIVTTTPDLVGASAVSWSQIITTPPTPQLAQRIDALSPDTIAAYMLTSGSTGRPKAVIQTHRMIATNLAQAIQTMGKAAGWDGPMLDWLPWNHVSGATAPLLAMAAGGTLYIDEGRPIPGPFFDLSLRNLRDVPISYYVNVPLGYAMLADALESDASLRAHFFENLRIMLYGGAGLPQPLLDRIQDMAVKTIGHKILGSSAYGATETTSGFMSIHYLTDKVGIGLPMPGAEVKLVPHGPRYELRVRGPITTPGYLNEPEKSKTMFDDEGFYCLGDYATFIDPENIQLGLAFAGRLAEEFKLASGTWVRGGQLKAELIKALAPWVSDLVICGDGGLDLGIMIWLSAQGAAHETANEGAARTALSALIAAHNKSNPGQSTRIHRALILKEPPMVEAHEISDKGTINRTAVIERRAQDVALLFARPCPAHVMEF